MGEREVASDPAAGLRHAIAGDHRRRPRRRRDGRLNLFSNAGTTPNYCSVEYNMWYYPDEYYDAVRAEVEAVVAAVCSTDPWLRDHPPVITWKLGRSTSRRSTCRSTILRCAPSRTASARRTRPGAAGASAPRPTSPGTARRGMLEQGDGGAIVNVTSIDALHPTSKGMSHYTTSKHALWGLTKCLALEPGPQGIRTNAVGTGTLADRGRDRVHPGGRARGHRHRAAVGRSRRARADASLGRPRRDRPRGRLPRV